MPSEKSIESLVFEFPHVLEGALLRISPGGNQLALLIGSLILGLAGSVGYVFMRDGAFPEGDATLIVVSGAVALFAFHWYITTGRILSRRAPVFCHRERGEVMLCVRSSSAQKLEYKVFPWNEIVMEATGGPAHGRLLIRPREESEFSKQCVGIICSDMKEAREVETGIREFMTNPDFFLESDPSYVALYDRHTKGIQLPSEMLSWGKE